MKVKQRTGRCCEGEIMASESTQPDRKQPSPPQAPPESTTSEGADRSAPATTPMLPDHGLDFLAPPEGPGEIGRLGGYRVLQELGAGGMGIVFLAEDPQLRRRVALKVMRPELATQRTARER